jgi:hypothetical protein
VKWGGGELPVRGYCCGEALLEKVLLGGNERNPKEYPEL